MPVGTAECFCIWKVRLTQKCLKIAFSNCQQGQRHCFKKESDRMKAYEDKTLLTLFITLLNSFLVSLWSLILHNVHFVN